MRLSKVKLSGFKSFVDQTTFVLTGKLNGIVGPNGCGKSNIIDAVRWVMGESSAKQLRGESMSDVIFNGSERRKPSGLASIELIFENEDGRLGGKWAEYREISVRRTLDRDGKSQYFLNGTRCRRRDITDIFLGTGLGPRSYAIIEQGMISRIVESKPEELRTFFEEAANISKYKERRHETEQRIEHTRTNLERLTDIRYELGKQLSKLDRQAATARRYQKLREEERALGYAQLYKQKEIAEAEIQHLIDSHESEHDNLQLIVANLNNVTTQLFDHKKSFESLEAQMNEKNGALYPYKQAVDHLDHELIRIRELEKRDLESQSEWQENGARLEKEVEETSVMVDTLEQQIDEHFYIVESESESIWQSEEKLKSLQESLEKAQYDFRKQQDQIKSLQQKLELDRHSLKFQAEKAQNIDAEKLRLAHSELPEDHSQSDEIMVLEEALLMKQMSLDELTSAIDSKNETLQSTKERYQALQVEQRKLSAQRNQLAGEVGMLEKMTVNDDKKAKSPLFEHLKVTEGWNGAVDSVLRQKLMVETERQRGESYYLGEATFEFTPHHLGYYVKSDRQLGSILSHIYCFDDSELDPFKIEADAQFSALRNQLRLHEFIVTKSGLLFGIDWAIYNREDANFGVLARQQSLEKAVADLAEIDERLEFLDESLYEQDETLKTLQNGLEEDQKALQKLSREQFELEKQLSLLTQQQTQAAKERHRIDSRLAELAKEESLNQALLDELQQKINDNDIALSLLEENWEAVSHRYESLKIEYDQAKAESEKRRTAHIEKKQQLDLMNHELLRFKERKERAESELNILKQRMEGQQKNQDYAVKIAEIEENRIIAIDNLEQFEATLSSLRIEYQSAKEQIQQLETQKTALEESLNDQKTKLNQFSIKEAELNAKREMLLEKWDSLLAEISDEEIALAKEDHLEKAIEDLELSLQEKREAIAKIGAVNLVAITESEELRERKEYLDTQNSDLESALAMLEKAINEIDDETRTRFMETFNAVNADFSRLFPRLFGGGRAYLELTEDDALTSGVNIIAHPPGKKPGTIHLLSGGEKALTAMALVFGIFNLNPAPFCMLDEVDAPLDEANVRRLGELIDEMSEKVQFIFITHNKATMTISDSLIGVTMAEPGVSRLVSVSLKDAIALSDE